MTYEDATAIDLKVLTPEQLKEEVGFIPPGLESAQRLVYFDVEGHPVIDPKTGKEFARFKLVYVDGWVHSSPKYMRYAQRGGTSGNMTYVPRGVGIDWIAVTSDPKEPIMITEGEYKAITACKAGIATVGLSGINSIDPQSRKMTVPLESITYVGRPIPICFDAEPECTEDEPLRPAIELKAAKALASKLTTLGAEPYMVYIAKTETFLKQNPRVKMGVDDFFHAGGTQDELMATATPVPEENLILAGMCQDWCVYLGSKPFVMNRHRPVHKHSPGDFKQTIVADKRIKVQDGERFKVLPAGEVFLQSPLRPVFHKMCFDPGSEFGLNQDKGAFNTWVGMATLPGLKGPAEFDRDIALFHRYLGGMVGEENVEYVEKWMAHIIQKPEEKTTIAIVLAGKTEGTGKSLFGVLIGALVGERYRVQKTFDEIFDHYGGHNLESKLLVQIEESEGVSKMKMARLRDFVTNKSVTINMKNVATYDSDNLARVLITANSLTPIKMEETSRRWFVTRTTLTEEQVKGWWSEWVRREVWERFCLDKSEDGDWPRRHLMYHLKNCVDLRYWEPNAPVPMTEAAEDMIEASNGAGELGIVELYGMLVQDKEGFLILPKNVQALNSSFWTTMIDYVKNKGGTVLRMETKAYGEKFDARVLCPPGSAPPTRLEGMGNGRKRPVLDLTKWGKDQADYMRAKDRLIACFEQVAPILRLSDDQLTAVRRYKGTKYS
jgi:hypothetical protein